METYKFIDGGTEITRERDKWGWIAIYKDGSYLKQYDDAGYFHQFKEINLAQLDVFAVQDLDNPTDFSRRYEIHIEEGMTPIFFTRITKTEVGFDKDDNPLPHRETKRPHFGYKETVNGKVFKTILEIHPSGALAIKKSDGREHLEEDNK